MPENYEFSLSELANALLQDFQAVAQNAAQLDNREALEAITLPTNTRDRLQNLSTTVNTHQQQRLNQRQQLFEQRREVLQLGLQQRQQLIAQAAILRHEDLKQPTPGKFVVTGRIVDDATGVGLPNVKIKAFDRDRKFDDLLGTVQTDQDGFYRLEYTAEQFREGGEDAPEVYIQVLDEADEPLYQSPRSVEIKSNNVETLDARISNSEAVPQSKELANQIAQIREKQVSLLAEKQTQIKTRFTGRLLR